MFRKNGKSFAKYRKVQLEGDRYSVGVPDDYDIYILSFDERRKYFIICGSFLGFAGYLFYNNLIIAIICCTTSILGIEIYKSNLAEKRRNELRYQFTDVLYSFSASISSGRQMRESISEAEEAVVLIRSRDSMIAREMQHMSRLLNESRCSEDMALRDLASRSKIEEIIDFADVYTTCRKTGGDIKVVINKASQLINSKLALAKDLEIQVSQKRLEVKILTAAPLFIIVLLRLVAPDYLEVLYTTMIGRIIMTLSLCCLVGAYFWSVKMTEINV